MADFDYKLAFEQWKTGLESANQIKENPYEGLVSLTTLTSNRQYFDIQGTVELNSMQTEDVVHSHSSIDTEQRQIQAAPAYVALKWQKGALARAHTSPIPGSMQAVQYAAKRHEANIVRTAATGTAVAQYEGEETSSSKSLSGDQVIADSIGGNTSMNEGKIRTIASVFERTQALQNGMRIVLSISREEQDALLQIERYTNNDYLSGNSNPLKEGMLPSWLGVDMIKDENLVVAASNRTCFAFLKRGILFGDQAGNSVITRMDEIRDRHYMDQFYYRQDKGATRTRESDVIIVNVASTY